MVKAFLAPTGLFRPSFAMVSTMFSFFFVKDGKDGKGQSEKLNKGHCYRKKEANVHGHKLSSLRKAGQGGRAYNWIYPQAGQG